MADTVTDPDTSSTKQEKKPVENPQPDTSNSSKKKKNKKGKQPNTDSHPEEVEAEKVSDTQPQTTQSQPKGQVKIQTEAEKPTNVEQKIESTSDITVPESLSKPNQVTEPVVETVPEIKSAEETRLPEHIKGPEFTISEKMPPETEQDKLAREQAQRLSEFRRRHMIFPSKESQEHAPKQPVGTRVISQAVEGLQSRLHRSPPIEYVDLDESRLISATTTSKKKQNFKLFKEWNQNRSKDLQCYSYVIDNLFKGADSKIKESFQHLEIYCTFFRERGNQEERYSSAPIIDTGYSLTKTEIGATAFSQCSEVMKTIGQFNLERCKKIQNFAYLIKKNIVADLLQNHSTKSRQELSSLKEKIVAVRNALNEAQLIISRKTVELSVFLQEHQSPEDRNKDYYYSQISFLRTASEITTIIKKYGQLTYTFFQLAAELEKERIEKVKSAIKIYIQGLKETYGFQSSQEMEGKLGVNDPKVIENIYNVSGLVDIKIQEFIKNEIQADLTQPLTAQQLKLFLSKLVFKPYDNRLLILKQFKTVNMHKDKANQTCHIVITVDKFIHIYLNTESAHVYAKPTQTFKIDPNLKVFRQGSVVEMVKSLQKKGVISYIIWEPPTVFKYVIQFAKDDAALEFQDCIKKLL